MLTVGSLTKALAISELRFQRLIMSIMLTSYLALGRVGCSYPAPIAIYPPSDLTTALLCAWRAIADG